ncbi:SPOR domain-containing protein [Stutzerimonas tarimensis]|uniref:SPOR domain-containing protein n=1 Tax=Stutzerimonas tarimensis TaxID=1507735 RepID=A0ABV7T3N5_9GAMM
MATKKAAPKRGASRYQPPPPRKPLPGWAWLACGLVIGAFGFFLFSLEPGSDAIKRPSEASAPAQQSPRPTPNGEQPPRPRYDFYTLLPESEVILPPGGEPPAPEPVSPRVVTPEEAARIDTARAEAALQGETPPPPPVVAAPPPPPTPAATRTQFFLQAGSFRRAEEADRVRAQILLLGYDVRVETGSVRGETWHRVLVGPYGDQGRLTQVQKQLAASGYSNLLPQKRQIPGG